MKGGAVISACERSASDFCLPLETCAFLVEVVAHGAGDEDVRCSGRTQTETGNPLRKPLISTLGIRRGQSTHCEASELGEPAEDKSAECQCRIAHIS